MKKLCYLLFSLLLIVNLVGCDSQSNNDHSSQSNDATAQMQNYSKRNNIPFEQHQMYAVGYAGYETMDDLRQFSDYLDSFDLPCHYISSGDFYVIIPRYDGMDLKLYKNNIDNDEKELVFEMKNCQSFIVNCNISDIFYDATIILTYKDEKAEFSPYVSLKDGSIRVGEKGYNLSPQLHE